ncbi:MAG: recombinase family protein [Sneathiella sp.]|uniref:recombinase family protein n=1 Tax=Sneathiella sp. TaxID=1964365 RepID=UPI0030027310
MAQDASQSSRFVAYYRVSTDKQGRSGLGLEAQQKAVETYVSGIDGDLIAPPYIEVESGKKKDRPELIRALAHAKRNKATLIVAKLDRLARNVSFVSALLDSSVDFRAADMPSANRFMIQIMSAVAEYEAQLISERTKAGLAARKARGLPLGNVANLIPGNSPAPRINKAKANAMAERMRPVVEAIRADGVDGVRAICGQLNERGYVTDRGNHWHPTSVSRLLQRLE